MNMRHKILIVDDEPLLKALLADYLTDLGYLPYTAENSMQALENLKAEPDLILLDINMPGMQNKIKSTACSSAVTITSPSHSAFRKSPPGSPRTCAERHASMILHDCLPRKSFWSIFPAAPCISRGQKSSFPSGNLIFWNFC